MARTDVRTVDEYIATQPESAQATLEAVRQLIQKAVPDATESISYQIPAYHLHGAVTYLGAWKEHFSLYPVPDGLPEKTTSELAPYLSGKSTLKFPYSERIPRRLITTLVKHQAAVNLRKHAEKTQKKAPRARTAQ